MKRTVIAISAALGLAFTTAGAAAAQGPAATSSDDQVEVTVSLSPLNYVQKNGKAIAASNDAVAVTKEFSGPREQVDKEIAAWQHAALTEGVEDPSGIGTMRFHIVNGTCGWSRIELKDRSKRTYDRQAVVKMSMGLNRPGYALDADTLIFSSSPIDLWTKHFHRTANLNGRSSWAVEGVYTVPRVQEYGATLIEATVVVADGVCNTAGPRVDNVHIS